MVAADGTIVTASETENIDLFFALRGGGVNFGVVTQFVLKLHPQRRTVFAGPVIFPPTVLPKLIALTAEWLKTAGENEGMLQVAGAGPDGKVCLCRYLSFSSLTMTSASRCSLPLLQRVGSTGKS